jgi:hypothetical protein
MELSFLAKVSLYFGSVKDQLMPFQTLNIPRQEAEDLVVSLILDEKIKGKIDQVNGLLILDRL